MAFGYGQPQKLQQPSGGLRRRFMPANAQRPANMPSGAMIPSPANVPGAMPPGALIPTPTNVPGAGYGAHFSVPPERVPTMGNSAGIGYPNAIGAMNRRLTHGPLARGVQGNRKYVPGAGLATNTPGVYNPVDMPSLNPPGPGFQTLPTRPGQTPPGSIVPLGGRPVPTFGGTLSAKRNGYESGTAVGMGNNPALAQAGSYLDGGGLPGRTPNMLQPPQGQGMASVPPEQPGPLSRPAIPTGVDPLVRHRALQGLQPNGQGPISSEQAEASGVAPDAVGKYNSREGVMPSGNSTYFTKPDGTIALQGLDSYKRKWYGEPDADGNFDRTAHYQGLADRGKAIEAERELKQQRALEMAGINRRLARGLPVSQGQRDMLRGPGTGAGGQASVPSYLEPERLGRHLKEAGADPFAQMDAMAELEASGAPIDPAQIQEALAQWQLALPATERKSAKELYEERRAAKSRAASADSAVPGIQAERDRLARERQARGGGLRFGGGM